jgi:hypothetical protein
VGSSLGCYNRDDPANETVAIGYSIGGIIADAAEKIGRHRSDFEVQEISRGRFEKLRRFMD